MGIPSGMELVIIVLVVLLLFGGKKIPELAKGLGSGIKNFKNAIKDDEKTEEVVTADKKEEIEKKSEATTTENKDNKTV